jgi:hypothetical protein
VLGNSRTSKRDNSSPARNSSPTNNSSGTISDPSGISEFNAKTSEQDPTVASSRSTQSSRSSRSRTRTVTSTTGRVPSVPTPETDLVAPGQSLTSETESSNGSLDTPVPNIPADNSPTLSSPNGSRLGDSPQVDSTRQYFQSRWRADPNFTESLQYNVRVGKDGKVLSVDGQTVASREYLKRTRFINPGNQVAGSDSQDRNTLVILKPDGSVEALNNP